MHRKFQNLVDRVKRLFNKEESPSPVPTAEEDGYKKKPLPPLPPLEYEIIVPHRRFSKLTLEPPKPPSHNPKSLLDNEEPIPLNDVHPQLLILIAEKMDYIDFANFNALSKRTIGLEVPKSMFSVEKAHTVNIYPTSTSIVFMRDIVDRILTIPRKEIVCNTLNIVGTSNFREILCYRITTRNLFLMNTDMTRIQVIDLVYLTRPRFLYLEGATKEMLSWERIRMMPHLQASCADDVDDECLLNLHSPCLELSIIGGGFSPMGITYFILQWTKGWREIIKVSLQASGFGLEEIQKEFDKYFVPYQKFSTGIYVNGAASGCIKITYSNLTKWLDIVKMGKTFTDI